MQSIKSSNVLPGARRKWLPPALTTLAIGTETKSAGTDGVPDECAEPQPPAAPAAKFGFSFEWSFPLSARIGDAGGA